jgi:hypothetical protein
MVGGSAEYLGMITGTKALLLVRDCILSGKPPITAPHRRGITERSLTGVPRSFKSAPEHRRHPGLFNS